MSVRWISRHGYVLAAASVMPLLVWWLGWYPGFASSDSIDQLGQIESGVIFNFHPAVHTLYMGAVSLGGNQPGLITLVQILALAGLLVYGAKWLTKAGVPTWLAVGIAWALGLSPAIAPTTLALWKDVPFGLFLLWAWIELLALAVDRNRLQRMAPILRLGLSLAGIWVFRGNGPLTVLPVIAMLLWIGRHHLKQPIYVVGVMTATLIIVIGPLYTLADVRRSSIEPAQVFLPDVAASFANDPGSFTSADLKLIEAVAPISIWTSRYDCFDSTPLLFDPEFDQRPVTQDPSSYRSLELAVLTRDFGSVISHRLCAANFIYSPPQPENAFFHRPPYSIPPNTLGLQREPLVGLAFEVTDGFWRWAEIEGRLWFTWRPAILIIPALVSVLLFLARPASRRFLIPSTLFVAHVANVMVMSPAQEFRYAYPLYLLAPMTLTLLWPTFSRSLRPRALRG
ncbi:MAG: hypothetical protein WBM90_12470 [Acidimicrobiia bacterium]